MPAIKAMGPPERYFQFLKTDFEAVEEDVKRGTGAAIERRFPRLDACSFSRFYLTMA